MMMDIVVRTWNLTSQHHPHSTLYGKVVACGVVLYHGVSEPGIVSRPPRPVKRRDIVGSRGPRRWPSGPALQGVPSEARGIQQ